MNFGSFFYLNDKKVILLLINPFITFTQGKKSKKTLV